MGAVAGLRGKVLLCHCSPQEPCHGDVLIEAALAAGGDEEADLSTSGEDSDGVAKPSRGAGWWGEGLPTQVGRGALSRG